MNLFRYVGLVTCCLVVISCSEENSEKPELIKCKTDKNCYKGEFICVDGTCKAGKRTPEELADIKRAEKEAERAEWLKSQKVKPGEGRLKVMLCDVFERAGKTTGGFLKARNVDTGYTVTLPLHDDRRIPVGQQIQFVTFPSLPLGTYHVDLMIGTYMRSTNENDFQPMYCHTEGKPCKAGTVRVMNVVLPEDEARRDSQIVDPDAKPEKKVKLSEEGIKEQAMFDQKAKDEGKTLKTSRCDFLIQ